PGAQRLEVVVEELAVLPHQQIERAFARVAKRRMSDVVNQRKRLDEIDVQVERCGDGARDLRDLHGVRQARAEMVRVAAGEDLSLVLKAAKGARMDDAVAVALERIAIRMRRLWIAAPAGILHANRVAGEHKRS